MSISNSIGPAMMNVAGNAMLGYAISSNTAALADTRNALDEWMVYSKTLEQDRESLKVVARHFEEEAQQAKDEYKSLVDEYNELVVKHNALQQRYRDFGDTVSRFKKAADEANEAMQDVVKQTRAYAKALQQRVQETDAQLMVGVASTYGLDSLLAYTCKATGLPVEAVSQEFMSIIQRVAEDLDEKGVIGISAERDEILKALRKAAPDERPDLGL